jgi:hypothetical protein
MLRRSGKKKLCDRLTDSHDLPSKAAKLRVMTSLYRSNSVSSFGKRSLMFFDT